MREVQERGLARRERRPLVATPQRFGILPTLRFWTDPDVFWMSTPLRLTAALTVLGLLTALALLFPPLLAGPWWLYLAVPPVCGVLGVGALERYIRHRVQQRHALPPAER